MSSLLCVAPSGQPWIPRCSVLMDLGSVSAEPSRIATPIGGADGETVVVSLGWVLDFRGAVVVGSRPSRDIKGGPNVSPTYGYARVSSIDQDLSIQRAALKAAGCSVIRAEKASGKSRDGRTELETLMQFIRSGDTLVVTRIDRLARSMRDLQNIVHELREKGPASR